MSELEYYSKERVNELLTEGIRLLQRVKMPGGGLVGYHQVLHMRGKNDVLIVDACFHLVDSLTEQYRSDFQFDIAVTTGRGLAFDSWELRVPREVTT